jgi:hypothetical protein
MVSLYLPVLYTLLQALLCKKHFLVVFACFSDNSLASLLCLLFFPFGVDRVTDWNNSHVSKDRMGINNLPCYYMACPPYRQDRLD